MSTAMNEVDVLSIRLDYLLHATVFLPLVPLWQLTRPSDPLWLMVLTGLLLASVAEGSHYLLPYRAFNINGLLGNVTGVLLGAMIGWLISLRQSS